LIEPNIGPTGKFRKIAKSKESSKKSVNHCIVQPTYLGDNAFIGAG
jgi:hypothetical protein